MRNNIKLTSKKSAKKKQKPQFDGFFFFVKDQGTGAARIIVIILKVLELIMTTIFGLVLGIFGPIIIMKSDLVDPEISRSPGFVVWIIASALYIIGMFVLMLGRSKTASAIHIGAMTATLITHMIIGALFADMRNNLANLYLPCVFITIMTLAVMLLINIPKVIEHKIQRDNEAAPSVFDAPTAKKRGK